jgi:hypothetical protein
MVCCSACNRHYFQAEPACPFCHETGTSLGRGLRRAAAVGAVAAMLTACTPKPEIIAPYGAPPIPSPSPSVQPSPSPAASPKTPE